MVGAQVALRFSLSLASAAGKGLLAAVKNDLGYRPGTHTIVGPPDSITRQHTTLRQEPGKFEQRRAKIAGCHGSCRSRHFDQRPTRQSECGRYRSKSWGNNRRSGGRLHFIVPEYFPSPSIPWRKGRTAPRSGGSWKHARRPIAGDQPDQEGHILANGNAIGQQIRFPISKVSRLTNRRAGKRRLVAIAQCRASVADGP